MSFRRIDGSRWTVEEMKELISLVDQGYSYTRLATIFGTTRSAISGKVMRLRDKGLLRR